LSPIPIIGVTVILAGPRARSNGPAFAAAWVVGLAASGVIVVALANGADASQRGDPAEWVSVLKLALGVGLGVLAVREWRGRPGPGEQAELPAWIKAADGFGPARAAGLGLALSALNPKNLLLVAAAAATIAEAGLSSRDEAIALAVFVIIGSLGTCVPVALFAVLGSRAVQPLDQLRNWMAQHNTAIMAVLYLIIGAKLVGDAISGL
jgi:threonine/homoserine/homoserine lactone efflux protein